MGDCQHLDRERDDLHDGSREDDLDRNSVAVEEYRRILSGHAIAPATAAAISAGIAFAIICAIVVSLPCQM